MKSTFHTCKIKISLSCRLTGKLGHLTSRLVVVEVVELIMYLRDMTRLTITVTS